MFNKIILIAALGLGAGYLCMENIESCQPESYKKEIRQEISYCEALRGKAMEVAKEKEDPVIQAMIRKDGWCQRVTLKDIYKVYDDQDILRAYIKKNDNKE